MTGDGLPDVSGRPGRCRGLSRIGSGAASLIHCGLSGQSSLWARFPSHASNPFFHHEGTFSSTLRLFPALFALLIELGVERFPILPNLEQVA